MGHASSIALGIANAKKSRSVWTFDGDGASIMHMGAMSTVGQLKLENYKHIVFNNGAHDSVGAQPSAGFSLNMQKLADGFGYQNVFSVAAKTEEEIAAGVK